MVLAGACSSTIRGEVSEACTLDSDCRAPFVCVFERCHQECASSRDCESGQRCTSLDDGPVCLLDDEMACGESAECVGRLECAVDAVCRATCGDDGDCASDQRCAGGVCADSSEVDAGSLGSCSGDDHEASGPSCFVLVTDLQEWDSARTACVGLGGDLATIRSGEALQAVARLVARQLDQTPEGEVWVGGRRAGADFVWSSGEPFDFAPWNVGFPGPDEDACVSFAGGGIRTRVCSGELPYVCEI